MKMRLVNFLALATFLSAAVSLNAQPADDAAPPLSYQADWRWVHGAVFVPTSAVNEAQQWDEYDPVINDRELHYASLYGINCVRVYLHYFIYLKKPDALLRNIEDFLTRADKYGIKVEFVFFDSCWNEPAPDILKQNYHYPNPIFGVHNSRWLVSPGQEVLSHYEENRDHLKAYVQAIVKAHVNDARIAFWETYNEPNKNSPGLLNLIKDARIWIHETGSKIPVTATGGNFCGDACSDFASWHNYTSDYPLPADPVHALNTECMCRLRQDVPQVVSHFMGKTGFIVWEFGIGRDNCRFYWGETADRPAATEHDRPFHGLAFADGHPWSTNDLQAWLGAEAYAKLPVFQVTYFRDTAFKSLAKESITPAIDFDLPDEVGYGSPDSSVHLAKDYYAIRWVGKLKAERAGSAKFFVKTDGAIKVMVAGRTVLEQAKGTGKEVSAEAAVEAGQPVPITVEYTHETGPASIHLEWTPPGGTRTICYPIPRD